jgi:small subunit ribosomal protein S24e
MEIEITDKKNNPFFKRMEVHFTISHENQKTPNQGIIRNELAESLNTKKENIIIDHIQSHYGIQKTNGYAKVYSSRKEAEKIEQKYLLNRNKMLGKKAEKKEESAEDTPSKDKDEQPVEKETAEESAPQEKQEET